MESIAHEIGHVIVGYGHPDASEGPAVLPGTDRAIRLMNSGGFCSESRAIRRWIVKGEWDEADKNLKKILNEQ